MKNYATNFNLPHKLIKIEKKTVAELSNSDKNLYEMQDSFNFCGWQLLHTGQLSE
jgi:hypothetical protein